MKDSRKIPVVGDGTWAAIIPFALITSCFALWGFANDVTTPLVKSFSKIFRMSVTEGTLVQVAFYGGYFAMAVRSSLFLQGRGHVGVGLVCVGSLSLFPGQNDGRLLPFSHSLFHTHLRAVFLGDKLQPLHPFDGGRRDSHAAA